MLTNVPEVNVTGSDCTANKFPVTVAEAAPWVITSPTTTLAIPGIVINPVVAETDVIVPVTVFNNCVMLSPGLPDTILCPYNRTVVYAFTVANTQALAVFNTLIIFAGTKFG